MPRLKMSEYNINFKELDEAEYNEDATFTNYDGEVPPKGTILRMFIKKLWWCETQNGDSMIKLLAEAADNEEDIEEYNGCPFWDNLPLITTAKFKWKPFLDHFGITLKDIQKGPIVADEDDNVGAPIEKLGNFVPGEDSDAAWCRAVTDREKFNGSWQARVGTWLDYEDAEEEPDREEQESEEPAEEEPAEVAPARGRRTAAKVPAKPARTAAKPAPARQAKPATATRRTAAAKPAATGRGRRAAAAPANDNEPPF